MRIAGCRRGSRHRRVRRTTRGRRFRDGRRAVRLTRPQGGGMILAFDVGNTELTIGLFSESELRGHWRVMTDVSRTSDEFGVLLHSLLQASGFAPDVVRSVAIG